MFDARRYLIDTRLPFVEAGHPKVSPGWIGISCPFCNSGKIHGGFNLEKGFYTCWQCGWHDLVDLIVALERISPHEAVSKLGSYEITNLPSTFSISSYKRAAATSLPVGSGPLTRIHKAYLENRGFDPYLLETKYGLVGAGPVGPYKFRIIAPIYLDKKLISFQGRDITGKAEIPYKACPKDKEVICHKDSLYNIDNAKDTAIVVEGIFDVWRIGDGAVATFGVGFRWTQVIMMANKFKKVFLLYDGEPKAQSQAKKIAHALNKFNVKVENISLTKGDPAELTEKEAKKLKEELLNEIG